jgi:pyruvate/2-oxoglutarate dehydrogenase complex dihydrolipoamide acyltransferase (E2) component
MPYPVHTPRVNNNDDTVQVIALRVSPGDRVKAGQLLAEVETDKSVSDVEAERDGFILRIDCELDQQVTVGSIMMWLGDSADEQAPEVVVAEAAVAGASSGQATAKARSLLRRYGLDVGQIPASGDGRLRADDVERYIAAEGLTGKAGTGAGAEVGTAARAAEPRPDVPGEARDLSLEERGMLHTVTWHRDHAAATYLEVEYDPSAWEEYAAAYAARHKLMLSPLLPLLAYRLVQLAAAEPRLNATLVDGKRYEYRNVNLGFTVQAGTTLYLTVIREAQALDTTGFLNALGVVQRHAMGHKLRAEEVQGATIGFSSMARWQVSRHMPILAPNTALMIAHAAPKGRKRAVLGASYDHRVLSGFDTAKLLQQLITPPADILENS